MISGNVAILFSALALGFMLPAAAYLLPLPRDRRHLPGDIGQAVVLLVSPVGRGQSGSLGIGLARVLAGPTFCGQGSQTDRHQKDDVEHVRTQPSSLVGRTEPAQSPPALPKVLLQFTYFYNM